MGSCDGPVERRPCLVLDGVKTAADYDEAFETVQIVYGVCNEG